MTWTTESLTGMLQWVSTFEDFLYCFVWASLTVLRRRLRQFQFSSVSRYQCTQYQRFSFMTMSPNLQSEPCRGRSVVMVWSTQNRAWKMGLPLLTETFGFIKTNLTGECVHLYTNSDPSVPTFWRRVDDDTDVSCWIEADYWSTSS